MNWRAQLAVGLALVGCALLAGWLIGRRPDPAQQRRIGELVERTRSLEAQRAAAWAVADSAVKRAAHSDSAAHAALRRADRLLQAVNATPSRPADAPPDSAGPADDLARAGAEIDRLQARVDTLTDALTDARNALQQQLAAAARLRGAVDTLTAQGRADSVQINRLQSEIVAFNQRGSGVQLSIGGGWKRAALFVGAGFIAGAVLTR